MAKRNTSTPSNATGWTSTQAYVMAVVCLLIGVAVGYFVRGSAASEPRSAAVAGTATPEPTAPPPNMGGMGGQVTPEQLKQMADTQAAPIFDRLKKEPNNAKLWAQVGNLYFDAHQFPLAIDYYQRSLKIEPGNTNVRTDLGTAMWYLRDPDNAIEQFKTVLKTEPTKPNALMNLGVVEWQGKMDVNAAIAAWEKLLATNPNFEGKDKVEQLIAQAKKHSNLQLGAKATKPAM